MSKVDHSTVPIKDYVDACLAGQRDLIDVIDRKNTEAVRLALDGLRETTKVALAAADAKGLQHNGVIEMLRQWMARCITRETVSAFMVGMGVVAAWYFGFRAG